MVFFCIAFAIIYIPISLLFPTKVYHKERMPKGKCILTSNHYSNFDAIIYDLRFGKRFKVLAKIELFKNKFLAFFMRCLGAIPVDREKVAPSTFKAVLGELKKDNKVFIFPEGTRNKSGSEEMGDAKAGVITFASKGEAEIVPMLIYKKPKIFRKNYIIVGNPFSVVGENPKRLTPEEVQQNLEIYTIKMEELRKELDEILSKKKNKKR